MYEVFASQFSKKKRTKQLIACDGGGGKLTFMWFWSKDYVNGIRVRDQRHHNLWCW